MACFPDPEIERILTMPDEEVLAEFRAAGGDPDQHAAEMRRLFDQVALFAFVEDVNGKPRPRWEELMEQKFNEGVFGEMLGLMRYLLELKEQRGK